MDELISVMEKDLKLAYKFLDEAITNDNVELQIHFSSKVFTLVKLLGIAQAIKG